MKNVLFESLFMRMKKPGYITIALYVILNTLIAENLLSQSSGLPFLRIEVDARSGALGGALTSSGSGVSSLMGNPAGVVNADGNAAGFSHVNGFQDISSDFIGLIWKRNDNQAFAFSLFTNSINGIQYRTRPTARPISSISWNDVFFGFTYSQNYKADWKTGVSVKYLYEKVYFSSAKGISVDAGLIYAPPDKKYTLGFSLKNAGGMEALNYRKPDMPTLIQLGAGYTIEYGAGKKYSFEFLGSFEKLFDGGSFERIGIEAGYEKEYYLRFGYISGFDKSRFSLGGGLIVNRFGFDYAYLPNITSFSNQHNLSISILF